MGTKIGNFTPNENTKAKAAEITRKDDEKYSAISEIDCESQFNGGLFFEHEVQKALSASDE